MKAVAIPELERLPVQEPEPLIRISNLKKAFPVTRTWRELLTHPLGGKRSHVLRGITCTIQASEIFGLLGPNGAGKTTLLKILSTLILPDEGSVRIAGCDVVQNPSAIRGLLAPVVADERTLMWRLSARENLRFYASLYNLKGSVLRDRVDELLSVVELDDTGNRMVAKFSSGMKQRLLIARALLSNPRVLLLDEPTRSLDPLSAQRFRAFLREVVVAKQGRTILLATHNPEEALDLSDRLGILHHGQLVAVGTPEELSGDVAGERYQLWTCMPDHPALTALAVRGVIKHIMVKPASDGWSTVAISIPDGADRAADVVSYLVSHGVRVARFERIRLSLAGLIGGVVDQQSEERSHA